jgi:hypothetical protein
MNPSCEADFVVCSKCGSEYQLHVTHCIDCGAPTRSPKEPSGQPLRIPPDSEDFTFVRSGTLEWAEGFGSFLEEHGIPWRLEVLKESRFPKQHFYHYVCVAQGDLDRAWELEQEYLRQENPGLAEELVDLSSTDQCPACGSRVLEESIECRSCGLSLSGPPDPEDDEEAMERISRLEPA